MKIRSLLEGIRFLGRAAGPRLEYDVFESDRAFLLFSPSKRGGFSVNIVDKRAPQRIAHSFGGKQVTSGTVAPGLKRLPLGADFPLGALYVMVAMGLARKLRKMEGNSLVFKVRGAR
jgi:hypothetical protein